MCNATIIVLRRLLSSIYIHVLCKLTLILKHAIALVGQTLSSLSSEGKQTVQSGPASFLKTPKEVWHALGTSLVERIKLVYICHHIALTHKVDWKNLYNTLCTYTCSVNTFVAYSKNSKFWSKFLADEVSVKIFFRVEQRTDNRSVPVEVHYCEEWGHRHLHLSCQQRLRWHGHCSDHTATKWYGLE